jgi:hypothetical protein
MLSDRGKPLGTGNRELIVDEGAPEEAISELVLQTPVFSKPNRVRVSVGVRIDVRIKVRVKVKVKGRVRVGIQFRVMGELLRKEYRSCC